MKPRIYAEGLPIIYHRIPRGAGKPPCFLKLNHPDIHERILPILQVEDPTLTIRNLKYIDAHRDASRAHRLYVRGTVYLYYDRHLHYESIGFQKALQEYITSIQSVVRNHILVMKKPEYQLVSTKVRLPKGRSFTGVKAVLNMPRIG